MDIVANLIEYLLTVTAITDETSTRIKPGWIAQGSATPYIIIKVVAADHDQELSGKGAFVKKTLSVECVSNSHTEAGTLHKIVRENLDSFQQQTMGTDNLWINSTRLTNEFDDVDDPQSANQKWTFIRTGIYDISYVETEALP